MAADSESTSHQRRYLWPWFVAVVFLLGIVLAFLWVSAEVRRTRERRNPNFAPQPTNASAAYPAVL